MNNFTRIDKIVLVTLAVLVITFTLKATGILSTLILTMVV